MLSLLRRIRRGGRFKFGREIEMVMKIGIGRKLELC
jgi:hypothetical protein